MALSQTLLLGLLAVLVGNEGCNAIENSNSANPDSTQEYLHFIPHNKTRTCSGDSHALPFNNQIRGVNLGGWFVLEPWITPSLFYQFLGKDEKTTATDIYSFCTVLGPEEGNKQLRRHWDHWVTQDIIGELAQSGAVNSLRLPVGDWMYKPYGPYIGCTDGALDYVDNLLDWAREFGLSVLFDIHGFKGSQNGFDNSGQSQGFQWTSKLNTVPAGDVTFEHWPIRSAGFFGSFDPVNAVYTDINHENIQHGLDVIEVLVKKYKAHPAVLGLEPMNEPWQYSPEEHLKQFYWDGYLIVKKYAPYWKYIIHDSFRFDVNFWGGFMDGCPDRALDTHMYQAWKDPSSRLTFYEDACARKNDISNMEKAFGPVIVGEWSLATDNCALWLNGFNDNLPGFPRLPCKYIPCADPYMGFDQPGTPLDPGKPIQGPFGTGMSSPIFGQCPVGRDWLKESSGLESGMDWIKAPPEAPHGRDATDEVMTKLAYKKINAFSGFGHGFYFWNFRTDIYEPHWSYMLALERGWIPKGNLNDKVITDACHNEDNGIFFCVSKRAQLESNLRTGIKYVLKHDPSKVAGKLDPVNQNPCPNIDSMNSTTVDNTSGDDLYTLADCAYNSFWEHHRLDGVTCDFGGTAELIEVNRTFLDDDDEFNENSSMEELLNPLKILQMLLLVLGGIFVGGFCGFCTAMRVNRKFNRSVARSSFGKSLKRNSILSRSFGGFTEDDYAQIEETATLTSF